jgi:alpha-glucosidase (family GH31 glycosyl hydrolase)
MGPLPHGVAQQVKQKKKTFLFFKKIVSSGHTQSDCVAYVEEYLSHNISVGGTDIDSQWATGDDSFSWKPSMFPAPQNMTDRFHALGVRVIVWATSMIDTNSPNFAYAKSKDYLLSKGKTVKWWHGEGGLLDFTNPAAMSYWKGLMDQVLITQSQVDGFKVSFLFFFAFL